MQKKGWAWSWARGASKKLGFPFNIYTMAEDIDFKFGTQLGFLPRPIIKSRPEEKLGVVLG